LGERTPGASIHFVRRLAGGVCAVRLATKAGTVGLVYLLLLKVTWREKGVPCMRRAKSWRG
jgi:hypothetical protein